ncbi:S1/P1 nuclease [Cadophora sp. MPI-SDFR-AT-0126]|nr:S1/P1 nuclease [Leotiomycetes sp. MPI-SDFR-AT-0126]
MKPTPSILFINILLVFHVSHTAAWGNLGHRTVALVAEKHLTDAGHIYVQNILGNVDISDAAIWADWYKDTPEGKSTGTWHFINGNDNPPTSCDLDLARDCRGERGCIVTAILNMTSRLGTQTTSEVEKAIALKFLIHLFGDLYQPLHTEALARGGNDIPVLFRGREYNLHFLWDVVFPQTITSSDETNEVSAAKSWARKLYDRTSIQASTQYTWRPSHHLFSQNDARPRIELARRIYSDLDVLGVARETNRLVCEYVLKDGLSGVKGKELSGNYYADAIPVVEQQIAKAGRSLGNVINSVAE